MAEDCVCMMAHYGRRKHNKDEFLTVRFEVSIVAAAASPSTTTCAWKKASRPRKSATKTIEHPRQAFLSASPDEQLEIMSSMIRALDAPYSLRGNNNNIHWCATESKAFDLENLDRVLGRLVDVACRCAREDERRGVIMDVRLRKVETLHAEEYDKLVLDLEAEKLRKQQPNLDNWIRENMNNVDYHTVWCAGFIFKLAMESPSDNKYFGIREVKVEEEEEKSRSCSKCNKRMEKGMLGLKMPCSHVFHGFCLLQWISVSPFCPFCQHELYPQSRDKISQN